MSRFVVSSTAEPWDSSFLCACNMPCDGIRQVALREAHAHQETAIYWLGGSRKYEPAHYSSKLELRATKLLRRWQLTRFPRQLATTVKPQKTRPCQSDPTFSSRRTWGYFYQLMFDSLANQYLVPTPDYHSFTASCSWGEAPWATASPWRRVA